MLNLGYVTPKSARVLPSISSRFAMVASVNTPHRCLVANTKSLWQSPKVRHPLPMYDDFDKTPALPGARAITNEVQSQQSPLAGRKPTLRPSVRFLMLYDPRYRPSRRHGHHDPSRPGASERNPSVIVDVSSPALLGQNPTLETAVAQRQFTLRFSEAVDRSKETTP